LRMHGDTVTLPMASTEERGRTKPSPRRGREQTHLFPRPLHGGSRISASWAIEPSQRAVVFVHGFFGSPCTTWDDFHELWAFDGLYAGHDLIFYGYDSAFTRAKLSACDLHSFLDDLFVRAAGLINGSLFPRTPFRPIDF